MAKLDKSVQITAVIIIGVIIVSAIVFASLSYFNPSSSNTISSNGEAKVLAAPDLVKIYFEVVTTGKTSQTANEENSRVVNNLILSLIQIGFDRDEIKTQNFNIYPEYVYQDNKQTLVGYGATHSLVVEMPVEKFSNIGEVIDAGVNAGAGISYLSFELSQVKQNEYKAEAIKLAAQDARIKAEALANGVGKDLGSVVRVTNREYYYAPWRFYESAQAAQDASVIKNAISGITPTDQEIYASVEAVFKLK